MDLERVLWPIGLLMAMLIGFAWLKPDEGPSAREFMERSKQRGAEKTAARRKAEGKRPARERKDREVPPVTPAAPKKVWNEASKAVIGWRVVRCPFQGEGRMRGSGVVGPQAADGELSVVVPPGAGSTSLAADPGLGVPVATLRWLEDDSPCLAEKVQFVDLVGSTAVRDGEVDVCGQRVRIYDGVFRARIARGATCFVDGPGGSAVVEPTGPERIRVALKPSALPPRPVIDLAGLGDEAQKLVQTW